MPKPPDARSVEDYFYGAVTIGERGQVVIPAAARKHHGLEPGEKLLVFRHPHARGIMLARIEDVEALVTELKQLHELMSAAGRKVTAKPKARKRRRK